MNGGGRIVFADRRSNKISETTRQLLGKHEKQRNISRLFAELRMRRRLEKPLAAVAVLPSQAF